MIAAGTRQPREIERIADSIVGRPWELGATGPHAFDCWGAVRYVLKRGLGFDVPVVGCAISTAFAYANAFRNAIRDLAPGRFDQLAGLHDLRDYDVALFGRSYAYVHCGIVLADDYSRPLLAHSREGMGVCVESLDSHPLMTQFPSVVFYRPVARQRAAG